MQILVRRYESIVSVKIKYYLFYVFVKQQFWGPVDEFKVVEMLKSSWFLFVKYLYSIDDEILGICGVALSCLLTL